MIDRKQEILEVIIEIFSLNPIIKYVDDIYNKNFFSEPFNLQPLELVYLLIFIEKKYNIKIEKEILLNIKFNNIENANYILKKVIK